MSLWTRLRDLATSQIRATLNPVETLIRGNEDPLPQSQNQQQTIQPPSGQAISPEQMAQITAALPQVQLQRLGAPEEQATRERIARDLMTEQQAGQRQLLAQQAKQGVRGGAAAAQQSQLAQRIAAQRAAQEQGAMVQQRMFNIEQAQKEQFGNIASEIARRQLAASLAGQQAQVQAARELGQAQLAAIQQQGGGGGLFSWLGL
jgi:hypothetical protein